MSHLENHQPANESIKPANARITASIQNGQWINPCGKSLTQAVIDLPYGADCDTSKAANLPTTYSAILLWSPDMI
jgi:hypothetical protein